MLARPSRALPALARFSARALSAGSDAPSSSSKYDPSSVFSPQRPRFRQQEGYSAKPAAGAYSQRAERGYERPQHGLGGQGYPQRDQSSREPREPRGDRITQEITGTEVDGFVLRNDPAYRIYVCREKERISPWHNVSLFAKPEPGEEGLFVNYICEIPMGTVEKMEIATKEPYNPIKQDEKNGKLRNYPFTSLVNYGMLPQTWEDPDHKDETTGLGGDNDPIDVCDISMSGTRAGDIRTIKVLGVLGMIDQGEMDWKIIGVNVSAKPARAMHTIADVERIYPGRIDRLIQWFRVYKKPDGKPENSFAFEGTVQSPEFALSVIEQAHQAYLDKAKLQAKGFWVG